MGQQLYMFQNLIRIKRAQSNEVIEADPVEQARTLCVLLGTSLPTRVTMEFAKMIGADGAKIFETLIDLTVDEAVSDTGKCIGRQGPRGMRHWKAKLNEKNVAEIFQNPYSAAAMAKKYDVNISTIYAIRRGTTWTDVTHNLERPKVQPKDPPNHMPPTFRRRMQDSHVLAVRRRFDAGEEPKDLAICYNTSTKTVVNIGLRKTYKNLKEE